MEELKKIEEEENIPMEKMKTPNEKIIDIPTGFFFSLFYDLLIGFQTRNYKIWRDKKSLILTRV